MAQICLQLIGLDKSMHGEQATTGFDVEYGDGEAMQYEGQPVEREHSHHHKASRDLVVSGSWTTCMLELDLGLHRRSLARCCCCCCRAGC